MILESFSDANRKCKTALVTSDLSSAETENVQINYKNKKKSKEMLQLNSTKHFKKNLLDMMTTNFQVKNVINYTNIVYDYDLYRSSIYSYHYLP